MTMTMGTATTTTMSMAGVTTAMRMATTTTMEVLPLLLQQHPLVDSCTEVDTLMGPTTEANTLVLAVLA